MKHGIPRVGAVMFLLAFLLPAVLVAQDDFPVFDSSTATYPLMVGVIADRLGMPPEEVKERFGHTHTFEAYKRLIAREVDIIISMPPTEELLDLGRSRGAELSFVPVGRDAFVFLVNIENPVGGLTLDQIRAIYTGEIAKWKEVGGEPGWDIIPFQRPRESGSQAIMETVVMQGLTMMEPVEWTDGMGGMMEAIGFDAYEDSIGYNIYYFATVMEPNPDVKLLAINGVPPIPDTIRTGEYPLIGDIGVIFRADEPEGSPVRDIVAWLVSPEGQSVVEETGYVSIH